MPPPVDSAGCSAWPICSLWHFAHRSSVHALLHKAAAWELRRRPCVSVRLRPALPCNPNFSINGLSINYWGYIVRQLPCVTDGSVDGKCFLLCVWQTAGGLLGAACWLYAQLLFSLWPRWELKPSVRPSKPFYQIRMSFVNPACYVHYVVVCGTWLRSFKTPVTARSAMCEHVQPFFFLFSFFSF